MDKIKEQLAVPPTEDSLRKVDRIFNEIFYNCEYSTDEISELNDLEEKIAAHYFNYLESQKDMLVEQLNKSCFSIHGAGGADVIFKQFIDKVKFLYLEFTPKMQDILHNVGLTILTSQFDNNRISLLSEQLCRHRYGNFVSCSHQLTSAESGELKECAHVAGQIINRQGKHKPIVLDNYLSRLTAILGRALKLTESDLSLHLQALGLIAAEMTGTIEMNAGSDPEIFWHRMLFEAVLDIRFSSEFMTAHGELIAPSPERWGLEELAAFIAIVRHSGKGLGYCTADFLSLLAKMDGVDNVQPVVEPLPVSDCPEDDDDRAVEYGEFHPPEVFTDEDRKRELAIFLQVVALEISGDFCHKKYGEHHTNWHVLVEMILGKRALSSPDAKQAIRLLSDLSLGGVKTSNLHFVDVTGVAQEALKQLDLAIKQISEMKPENITIQQNGNCNKVSVSLWRAGKIFHGFEMPAITEQGIPYESMAMAIQLLTGNNLMKKLFSYQGRSLEFRYHEPSQLEVP